MLRETLLWLYVGFLAMYAWRDWYKALCGLVLLMAVVEHPDMPKSMFGFQGLNPWNMLLGVIIMAWASARRREGLNWDMPKHINWLLITYLVIVLVGFFRLLNDWSGITDWLRLHDKEPPTSSGFWSEYFINTIKWVIPGLLLFDGCRDRNRFNWALASLLTVYVLLALQVIRWMPLDTLASGDALTERSLKIISKEIGYHRVNMAAMLAGAVWAIYSTHILTAQRLRVWLIILICGMTFFALGLTGGRTGYGTWAAVGLVLCVFRWRKLLIWAVPAVVVMAWVVPASMERLSQGFTAESRDTNVALHGQTQIYSDEPDAYTITAGRNVAWPHVIDKINDGPFMGHGREAMVRMGISSYLWTEFGESFPHPHNAYLQFLLDNGWIGFLPVMLFYLLMLRYSLRLFRDSSDPLYVAVGGVTTSLLLALLVASLGSQTFYPREGAVGMWCAIGLMMRVYVERARLLQESYSDTHGTERKLWMQTA